MKKSDPAIVEGIFQGRAYGSVAKKLLANGMRPDALRTNDTLRKDEWKALDETVVQISRQRLVGVNDLVSRGLVYTLNGMGTTVLQYEDMSDMTEADISMDGATRGQNDRVEYDIKSLPLPIIHKGFQVSARVLESSRKLGQPLDTTQAAIAARKVAEKIETILFTGASTYTFGGGTIYGYTDHPNGNTVSFSAGAWDVSAGISGSDILYDVLAMKQASINDSHYGPWVLYVPTTYETLLDDDFKAETDGTIRQRILGIAGIEAVRVADKLTDGKVVLVEMSPETARIVIGMQPTTLEWDLEGGMILHYKVMSIMVPQLRADQDGKMGLVVLS